MRRMRFQAYLLVMAVVVAAAGIGGPTAPAHADGPVIVRGDLIVEFGQWCGEGCEGEPTDLAAVFSPGAALKGAVSLGNSSLGSMVTANDGDLWALAGGAIMRIPDGGDAVTEFQLQLAAGQTFWPTGIAFDDQSRLYLSGYLATEDEFSNVTVSAGVFRASGSPQFFEQLAVGALPESEASQGLGVSGCTVTYWGYETVRRYDWCGEDQLSDFEPGFAASSDVVVLGDGTLLTAETDDLRRYYPDGFTRIFGGDEVCATSADAFEGRIYYTAPCHRQIRYFDMLTGETGVFREFTPEELSESYGDGRPVRLRVARGAVSARPLPPVIYVHGWGASVNDTDTTSDFYGLLSTLEPTNPERRVAVDLRRFEYVQDEGNDYQAGEGPNGVCDPLKDPRSVPTVVGSMASAIDNSHSTERCDSESDLAFNAAALREDVIQAFEESDQQRVIIIAHSMGAAITRGFLAYSADLDDHVSVTTFKAAIFLQGAHEGIWALPAITGAQSVPFVGGVAQVPLGDWLNVDADRPAGYQLQPNSDWYEWANSSTRGFLPGNYYNVRGDIRLKVGGCALVCFDVPLLPVSAGLGAELTVGSVGDGVIFPGTDDPYDTSFLGGSSFKRQVSSADHQWALRESIHWKPTGIDGVDTAIWLNDLCNSSKVFHFFFSHASLSQFTVKDCADGDDTSLQEQLLVLIEGLVGQSGYACTPE